MKHLCLFQAQVYIMNNPPHNTNFESTANCQTLFWVNSRASTSPHTVYIPAGVGVGRRVINKMINNVRPGVRSTGRGLVNILWCRGLFGETTMANLKRQEPFRLLVSHLFLAGVRVSAKDLKWGMFGGFKKLQDSPCGWKRMREGSLVWLEEGRSQSLAFKIALKEKPFSP